MQTKYDLFRPVPDAIHSSNPCYLVGSLEYFGHALLLCHLLDDVFQLLLTASFDLGQVLIQLAGR